MDAPYDEDISTPHEKALGKICRVKRHRKGDKERLREIEGRKRKKGWEMKGGKVRELESNVSRYEERERETERERERQCE